MSKKCKKFLSALICAVFMVMSIASINIDADNVAKDCDFLPTPVNKTQTLNFKLTDIETFKPISGATIRGTSTLFFKQPNGINCIFESNHIFSIDLTTDANGVASIPIINEFHSDQDYVVIEVNCNSSLYYYRTFGSRLSYGDASQDIILGLQSKNINP